MRYGLSGRGTEVRFPAVEIYLSSTASTPALRSSIQYVPEALCLGVKRLQRETDHSLPSSANVNQ
jgi:hypothetical protein